MNSSRFETYDAMRAEVLAFIESRPGSRMTETKVHKHDKILNDPMDLDSVVKSKGKNKFSGSCYIYFIFNFSFSFIFYHFHFHFLSFSFSLLGAQNLIFGGPQFRYDFS